MKKLVLDRLIDEVAKPGRLAAERAEFLQQRLASVTSDRDLLAAEVERYKKSELPFSDLARAADAAIKARPGRDRAKALSHLGSALCVANQHIEWIPF